MIREVKFESQDRRMKQILAALNENGICVRGGFHCAALAHRKLKTLGTGVVRASFSPFNTFEEVDYMIKCLKNYEKV